MKFIDFTGEETEKEFLEKCLAQWHLTGSSDASPVGKLIQLGSIFSEIQHRIDELR